MFNLKPTNAVQLQGIGYCHALPAADLIMHDETIWNYGGRAMVVAKRQASARFVEITLRSKEGDFPRRFKADRLIGVTRETYLRHRPEDTSRKVQFAVAGAPSAMPVDGIYSE